MGPWLPMILRILAGMGGHMLTSGLVRKLLGTGARAAMGRAGAALAGPAAKALGPKGAQLAGGIAARNLPSFADVLTGLPGFVAGDWAAAQLLGGHDEEQAAQMQYASPHPMAQQNAILYQMDQETALRQALAEMGIDLDDLLTQAAGNGGLV